MLPCVGVSTAGRAAMLMAVETFMSPSVAAVRIAMVVMVNMSTMAGIGGTQCDPHNLPAPVTIFVHTVFLIVMRVGWCRFGGRRSVGRCVVGWGIHALPPTLGIAVVQPILHVTHAVAVIDRFFLLIILVFIQIPWGRSQQQGCGLCL